MYSLFLQTIDERRYSHVIVTRQWKYKIETQSEESPALVTYLPRPKIVVERFNEASRTSAGACYGFTYTS